MTVSAISTVSIVLRNRAREALPLADREDSLSAESSPLPVEEIAGTRPASSPVAQLPDHSKSENPSIDMYGVGTRQIAPVRREPLC